MALEKGIVSINMGQGLDLKDDAKVGDMGTYLDLRDFTWNKLKRLDKRPGAPQMPTSLSTDFPNPLTIGQSNIPSSVFAHKEQLCLQNKGALYSYNDQNDSWQFKGHYFPLTVKTQTVVSGPLSIFRQSAARVGGLIVYTYLVRDSSGTNQLKYTVQDADTGSFLIDDVTVSSYFDFNTLAYDYHGAGVCYFAQSNRAFLIYSQSSNVFSREINLTNGTLSAATTLQTDAAAGAALDFVYVNKTGVGERVFICYPTATNARVFSITSTGAVDTTMGSVLLGAGAASGVSVHYNQALDRLFCATVVATSSFTLGFSAVSFTSSSITAAASVSIATVVQQLGETRSILNAVMADNPFNASLVDVFFTEKVSATFDPSAKTGLIQDDRINRAQVNASSVVTAAQEIARGVSIMARPVLHLERLTTYLPVQRYQTAQTSFTVEQSAAFLMDVYRGKTEAAAFMTGRWSYLDHVGDVFTEPGPLGYAAPSRVAELGDNRLAIPTRLRVRQDFGALNVARWTTALSTAEIDLAPEYAPDREHLANNTYLTGGHLSLYDGVNICEDNFFLAPEYIQLQSPSANDRLLINKVQDGTASVPEITEVTLFNAPLVPKPSLPSSACAYWTFNTPSTGYYVWYLVESFGVDPAIAGRTGIQVNLNGNETAFEVARKTVDAIIASGALVNLGVAFTTTAPGAFRITNVANGNVTDTAVGTMTTSATGPAAGTYWYTAVWSWLDQNGQLHRSTPSVPVSITSTGKPIGAVIAVPPITNRLCSQVQVELYRSPNAATAQTTYYKLIPYSAEKTWSAQQSSVGYLDNVTSVVDEPPLYTTGGVLDNTQVGPCKALSVFKNRLLVSGMDANSLYYSKVAINGEPVNFAPELFIRTDNDDQPIVGHAQLDDKLVIFKESQIEYRAGDGANDLGANSSFSLPVLVASDTGCINPNTIALYPKGLFFQSKLGLQTVNRAMQVEYVGLPVDDYNTAKVSRAQVLLDNAQVREVRFVLQDQPLALVYDYIVGKWGIFTQYGGTDAALWKGVFVRVDEAGRVWRESRTVFEDTGAAVPDYNPTLTTQWLKIKNVQDFQRIYRLSVLGDLKSAHTLRFKIYYDYDDTNFDEYNFASSNISGSQPGDTVYQPQIHLSRQKCQAIKIQMIVLTTGAGSKECLTLTDMSFEVGMKAGLMKVRAAKRL